MKATEACLAWTPNTDVHADNPTRGQVALFYDDAPRNLASFPSPYFHWMPVVGPHGRAADRSWNTVLMFVTFNNLVVRDRIDPEVADKVFTNLEEYSDAVMTNCL